VYTWEALKIMGQAESQVWTIKFFLQLQPSAILPHIDRILEDAFICIHTSRNIIGVRAEEVTSQRLHVMLCGGMFQRPPPLSLFSLLSSFLFFPLCKKQCMRVSDVKDSFSLYNAVEMPWLLCHCPHYAVLN
jgi:hypothetical protein